MKKQIILGVVAYNHMPQVQTALKIIDEWAAKYNSVIIYLSAPLHDHATPRMHTAGEHELHKCNFLVAIGGDGTFLSAAKFVAGYDVPILGVNTGNIGFLADYPVEALPAALESIAQENYAIRERFMMDLFIRKGKKILHRDIFLNEVNLKPRNHRGMVNLAVKVNSEYLTNYWADSLLISTPTGSTAYNLSAGGPILYPTTEAIILNPVNPSSLSVRPLIIPSESEIIAKETDNMTVQIILDGRVDYLARPSEEILIRKSKHRTCVIKSRDYGFVDALREKLGWSGSNRLQRIPHAH